MNRNQPEIALRGHWKQCDEFYKQPPDLFYKKSILKNFEKFTAEHLCQCLIFNKAAGP